MSPLLEEKIAEVVDIISTECGQCHSKEIEVLEVTVIKRGNGNKKTVTKKW